MDITYLGHSAFKFWGKSATVVTDPYSKSVGFEMPKVSADIITISHHHDDHEATNRVAGTSRRAEPYVVDAPGEYEVSGVGVFGWQTYHDDVNGAARGKNTVFVIHIDGIRVVHLGDLGHELSDKELQSIGEVDVALVPVGGVYTLNASKAYKVATALQPGIVVPMHYKTNEHDSNVFGELEPVGSFLQEAGTDDAATPQDRLSLKPIDVPEEMEVVVLRIQN